MITKEEKSRIGRASRIKGAKFEKAIREELELEGWIVTKWNNNIDLDTKTMIAARSNRFRARSTGFPDFLCLKPLEGTNLHSIRLIEVKYNGYLDPIEREKCDIITKLTGIKVEVIKYDGK